MSQALGTQRCVKAISPRALHTLSALSEPLTTAPGGRGTHICPQHEWLGLFQPQNPDTPQISSPLLPGQPQPEDLSFH